MTDFIHEAPPPENPKPAAPEKPTSEKERQKRVYAYIAVLFTVAFILILWSFLANHRSNQQVIDQLKGSTSMMQSTLEQNAKLEDEVKALETQVGELEQTLAETEDALSAARADGSSGNSPSFTSTGTQKSIISSSVPVIFSSPSGQQ